MVEQRVPAVPALTDLLFEKAGVGLCLVAPDGTVVRANAEWLRSTGFTSAQVIGEGLQAVFSDAWDMISVMHARARAGESVPERLALLLVRPRGPAAGSRADPPPRTASRAGTAAGASPPAPPPARSR